MSNQVYAIEQIYVDITSFEAGPSHKFDILPKWDYRSLAEAFGVHHHRAETVSSLNEILKKLKNKTNRLTLVEVVILEKNLPRQMYRLGTE
jgi:indolepyruvate decarboxylase